MYKSKAIFTVGAPRSGKTTWARLYQQTHERTALLSLDDLRVTLCGSKRAYHDEVGDDPGHPLRTALNELHDHALSYLLARCMTVVVHNTHLTRWNIDRSLCTSYVLRAETEFVVFDRTIEELRSRNASCPPEDAVPDGVLMRMHDQMQSADAWWRSVTHRTA